MKYDLGSDLHVDINARAGMVSFKDMKNEGSNTIVLAGDLANDPSLTTKVLAMAASVYENVIFVDCNHEHYNNIRTNMNVAKTMDYLRAAAKAIPNVVYLTGNNSIIIDDIMFVGANTWYDFKMQPPQYSASAAKTTWHNHMNDDKLSIFDKQPEVYAAQQAKMIAKVITDAQDNQMVLKIVVVTHTVPSPKGLLVKHDPIWDLLNGAFGCSDMANVFAADVNRKIVHSVFGHTHYGYDFDDFDGIRFVCNPRGYHGYEGDVTLWSLIQLDTDDERPKVL